MWGRNSQTIRLIPEKPGLGGTKTALSSHNVSMDVRLTSNVLVHNARWVKAPSAVNLCDGVNFTASITYDTPLVLHVFSRYDTTNLANPVLQDILGHNIDAASHSQIWSYSGLGASYKTTPNFCVPASFIDFNNRCFIAWGGTKPFIIDHLAGVRIYDMGVLAPFSNMTYALSGFFTGFAWQQIGNNYIVENWDTSPGAPVWTNVAMAGHYITVGGVDYLIQKVDYEALTVGPGTATVAGGPPTSIVTINGVVWNAGEFVGMHIQLVDGVNTEMRQIVSYVPNAGNTDVTVTTVWANAHAAVVYKLQGPRIVIDPTDANPTVSGASGQSVPYTAFTGHLDWDGEGPTYQQAFYSSTTAHCSNVGPALKIVEKHMRGVDVTLSNIQTAAGAGVDGNVYDRTVIFRSYLANTSGQPYLIGNNPLPNLGILSTDTTFVDTFKDIDVTDKSAPQSFGNAGNDPPRQFLYLAMWDGRMWGTPLDDQTVVCFSQNFGDPGTQLGIPQESFPSLNVIRIPADDGQVTGLRLMGDVLVVMTARYAYYIAGNTQSSYRLRRFSSTMGGVGQYQAMELAGDTDKDADAVVYLARERRANLFQRSQGNIFFSRVVQDLFENKDLYYPYARLHPVASIYGRWLIFSLPSLGNKGQVSYTLVYDYENQTWYTFDLVDQNATALDKRMCFATTYSPDVVNYIASKRAGAATLFSWLNPLTAATIPNAYIETPPLDFGRKGLKQLDQVRIYVSLMDSMPITPFVVTVTKDEDQQVVMNATDLFAIDKTYALYPESPLPFPADIASARELVFQPIDPVWAHRFTVRLTWPNATVESEVYAMDITSSDVEEAPKTNP